ncbi:MAG: radical SAM family heme chaperone HemW [Candidatus Lernaella stagnicola]|nr:radical SAM family heme chaperone HemW [Candidatus Lernaella stagnicola]
MEKNNTGIYLHIPFCTTKCGYCSFNSVPLPGEATLGRYLRALAAEIDSRARELAHFGPETIYFGGGTPSLVAPADIEGMIRRVTSLCAAGRVREVTLEANPVSLDEHNLAAFRAAGVDRLSIGVQTFRPRVLEFLECSVREGHAVRAYQTARELGFENIGLDLIVGLPEPYDTVYRDDLETLLQLRPEHVSAYLLSLESDAAMYRRLAAGEFALPDGDRQAEVFLDVSEALAAAGYEHYEVSNFARPGFAARHNSRYWTGEPYHGFGAGAHSLVQRDGRWIRYANLGLPADYMEAVEDGKSPLAFQETLTAGMMVRERMMLQLRTAAGLAPADFPDIASDIMANLSSYVSDGLFSWDGERFRPTPAGMLLADGIAKQLWDLVAD